MAASEADQREWVAVGAGGAPQPQLSELGRCVAQRWLQSVWCCVAEPRYRARSRNSVSAPARKWSG